MRARIPAAILRWPAGWHSFAAAGWLLPVLMLAAGCQATGSEGGFFAPAPRTDDVVAIRHFYSTHPWLRDSDGRITGLCVRTYFVSGKSDKGVFVPGTIRVSMTVLQRGRDGTLERVPAYTWTFNERQAAGFRVVHTATPGDSYGFVLRWPAEVDVMGRRVELTFSYERLDRRVVTGPIRQLRVPLPLGYRGPLESGTDDLREWTPGATSRPGAP